MNRKYGYLRCFHTVFIAFLFLIGKPLGAQSTMAWKNLGPYGGLINGLVADTRNPGTLLAGTATGEIYKTTNHGQNWFYLNSVGKPIRTLLMDTLNPQNLYVFARHDVDSSSTQVYVSTNGGSSWSSTYDMDFGKVFDAMINPLNTTQIYAISPDKIVRSINRGLSWSPIWKAMDTCTLTAMAVHPTDAFFRFAMAYRNLQNRSVIQFTHNGGYYFITRTILSPGWVVNKIFLTGDTSGTTFAILGWESPSFDSIKIIYTNKNSNWSEWQTVFAKQLDYRFQSTIPDGYRWLTFPDPKTFVVSLQDGIYKTNNGGLSWYLLPWFFQPSDFTKFLTRSFVDTTTLFAFSAPSLVRFTIESSGYLGATIINYGLEALPVHQMIYADEENLIARVIDPMSPSIHFLLFSQNQGLDYEILDGNTKPINAFWSNLSAKFIWIEEHGRCYTSPDMRTKDSSGFIFPPGAGQVVAAFCMNYPSGDRDSTLMLAAVSSGNPLYKGVWMSLDDGQNWVNINRGVLQNTEIRSISAYMTTVFGIPTIRILAASENTIFATLKNGFTWNSIHTVPVGERIGKISSNFNNILIEARQTNQTSRLYISRFLPDSAKWYAEDITHSLQDLFRQNGQGQIIDVLSADDGNYLILHHTKPFEPVKRKLYKTSYNPQFVRWVEISESPVDLFLFSSASAYYSFRDNSFNVYASANNGIWRLKQYPVITQDTLVNAPSAEVRIGESQFSLNYYNAGSAFAYIKNFTLEDPEGNFLLTDSMQMTQGMFLDIKTATPLSIIFRPKSAGQKQAILKANLIVRKSNGLQDSTIALTTRLIGIGNYAQISTGIRNDSLDFKGNLLGSAKVQSFILRNIGNTILRVDTMYFQNVPASRFMLLNDTLKFALTPGQSRIVQIRYEADKTAGHTQSVLVIRSNAYDPESSRPDTVHRVFCMATASGIQTDIANQYPLINQNYSFQVALAKMKSSSVSGMVRYKPLGAPNTALKQRNLELMSTSGDDLQFTATIPSEDIIDKGILLSIEVSDGIHQLRYPSSGEQDFYHLPVRIPSPGLNSSSYVTLPGGTSAKAYRLISFPIRLSEVSAQGAFRASYLGEAGNKGDWQLYRYDHAAQRFISLTEQSFGNIETGRSYLLITRQPKVLYSGSGITTAPSEAHVRIHPGWNMIATPYTFGIPWRAVVFKDSNLNLFNIVQLENGRFRYVTDPYTLVLEPWKGYLYYSGVDSSMTIFYPPMDASLFPSKVVASPELLKGREYAVNIELAASSGEILSSCMVGERADAADGNDQYDRPALPRWIGQDAEIVIEQNHTPRQTDFRPFSVNGSCWNLTIINHTSENYFSLMQETLNALPDGFQCVLIDQRDGRLMVLDGRVEIRLRNLGTAHYQLVIGNKEFIAGIRDRLVPEDYSLSANYPNPFNPSTTINYGLPERSRVVVAIYNILGQKVRTLYSGEQPGGLYRLIWDGRNDSGLPVSSGVYVYRLRASSLESRKMFDKKHKMMLIK